MNSTLLCVALVSTLAIGCGRPAVTARAPSKPAPATIAAVMPIEEKAPEEAAASEPAKVAAPSRTVGDFIVHRFSGSFRDAPLTLTQRVIAREGDVLVIDMTLDEGGSKRQALRVRMDESKGGEVVRVSRMVEGLEKEASLDDFDAMMAKTAIAADQNEEVLGTEDLTVDVNGASIPAQKTSFRVRLGKVQATLKTVQSDRFAWGDLGGEITSSSGDVIYRAELVEAGHGDGPKEPAVAKIDEYEDLDEE